MRRRLDSRTAQIGNVSPKRSARALAAWLVSKVSRVTGAREALRSQCPVNDLVVIDGQPLVAWRVIEDVHEYCSARPVSGGLALDPLGARPGDDVVKDRERVGGARHAGLAVNKLAKPLGNEPEDTRGRKKTRQPADSIPTG